MDPRHLLCQVADSHDATANLGGPSRHLVKSGGYFFVGAQHAAPQLGKTNSFRGL